MTRPPWSWPGFVAVVLALALGVGWSVAVVVSALHPDDATTTGLDLLMALGQTLAGGVVGFLGYQVGAANRTAHEDHHEDHPGDHGDTGEHL